MFQTVPLSIIRSFSLYTQQWYVSYRFPDSLWAGWACSQAVSKPVWHIPLLCVQWKTPNDGQRNCLKHVEFYSKNKLRKLVHLVGFIIRIYHDARSPEHQAFITCYSQNVLLNTALHNKIICLHTSYRGFQATKPHNNSYKETERISMFGVWQIISLKRLSEFTVFGDRSQWFLSQNSG